MNKAFKKYGKARYQDTRLIHMYYHRTFMVFKNTTEELAEILKSEGGK